MYHAGGVTQRLPASRAPHLPPAGNLARSGRFGDALTAGTGATLGALAGRRKHAGPDALVDSAMAQAARMTLGHRGTINEFIGDAILVLFGTPFERPDDAARAVRCAWAMQRAMSATSAARIG